jgi:hypothetical protein
MVGRFSFLTFVLWNVQISDVAQTSCWMGDKLAPFMPGSGLETRSRYIDIHNCGGPVTVLDPCVLGRSSMSFTNAPLKITLSRFGCQMSLDVTFDESVRDLAFTTEMKNVTVRQAFESLLKRYKLSVRMKDDYTLFVFADTPENMNRYAGMEPWPETPPRNVA